MVAEVGEAVDARMLSAPQRPGRIRTRLRVSEAEVIFEIEDNGLGLPNRDRDRLVEPYVTHREKGTGLGLAIVKRILEEHGGDLVLTDADEKPGAKVLLRFPSARPSALSGSLGQASA